MDLLGQTADVNVDSSLSDVNTLLSDPDQLRQTLLLTGGITEDDLANFDDETLMQLAQELFSQQTSTSTNSEF